VAGQTVTVTQASSTTLANISTRLRVETGDNALIGGFIITGTQPKRVIVRGIGPSLPFSGKLDSPTLELHGPNGLIDSNDNWISSPNRQAIMDSTIPPSDDLESAIEANDNWADSPNKQAIIDSTIAPANDLESAIVQTLPANGAQYTAIVHGVNDTPGIAVVEVYALQ